MAKQKKGLQNTTNVTSHTFVKGLNKDSDPTYVQEGMWTHAVNAVNNTVEGNIGAISNESSNFLCSKVGETMPATVTEKFIIGAINVFSDNWLIYTAGHNSQGKPITSEIGLLKEDRCIYLPVVQDPCLKFDKRYLISGAQREKEDCSWQVYWADGLNPDRYINLGDPKLWPDGTTFTWLGTAVDMNYYTNSAGDKILWPGVAWTELPTIVNNCEEIEQVNTLDCDKIRLARLMDTPCIKLKRGTQGGELRNGTYFAMMAYTINSQKVTDYFSQSNNQFIFTENDLEGSLDLEVEADFENFDEFVLIIVQTINQGTVAKEVGNYSTRTNKISIDQLKDQLVTVPIEDLNIQTPIYETSDQMVELNNYLIRVGPTSKLDFNYQPLANLIKAKWVSTEYPGDYYVQGGNKTSYLRDETYAFFIRWVYDTGDKSASYHIPGRAVNPNGFTPPGETTPLAEDFQIGDKNNLYGDEKLFEIYNTATLDVGSPLLGTITDDGGTVIAVGDMGYWESTEKYPDNKPLVWNASSHYWTGVPIDPATGQPAHNDSYDLCGLPIRHHKFPESFINNSTIETVNHFKSVDTTSSGAEYFIRIMGVAFENIILPKDNDGNDIENIAGYEILRGSREGNQTIIAKGMVNNFRDFKIRGSAEKGRTGLYANYPFNTILPFGHSNSAADHNYLHNDPYIKNLGDQVPGLNPNPYDDPPIFYIRNQNVVSDVMTFHSPDTMFRSPFLSNQELKLYGFLKGTSTQQFKEPDSHPQFKLFSDLVMVPIFLLGIAEGLFSLIGQKTERGPSISTTSPTSTGSVVVAPGGGITQNIIASPGQKALSLQAAQAIKVWNTFLASYGPLAQFGDAFLNMIPGAPPTQYEVAFNALKTALLLPLNTAKDGNVTPLTQINEYKWPKYAYLPGILKTLGGFNQFLFYFQEGASLAVRALRLAIPKFQYALQSIAHGYYSEMKKVNTDFVKRFLTPESFYLRNAVQEVSRYQDHTGAYKSYAINNLKRSDTVVVRTKTGPQYDSSFPDGVNIGPTFLDIDKSLVTLGTLNGTAIPSTFPQGEIPRSNEASKDVPFSLPIASYYAALKFRLRNQYGQLNGIQQITVTPCEQKLKDQNVLTLGPYFTPNGETYNLSKVRTQPLYNGDTYINRYTEKNTMFFFQNWLYNKPDETEYNYILQKMIPEPRFWVNSKEFDVQDLAPSNFLTPSGPNTPSMGTGWKPTSFYNLDFKKSDNRYYDYEDDSIEGSGYPGFFRAKDAYFYLTNSGVKDFFVESEVLVDFREQGDSIQAKHYDPYRYTEYEQMFNTDPKIITAGNTYLYDYSLSVSKIYNQYFTQGNLQNRNYDPSVAELCYTYLPDRILYSLPQQIQSFKDSWFVFLANNYKEFESQISGAKPVGKTGLLLTFKNASPLMFQGVDQREDYLGVKATIGDGGLFAATPVNVTLADKEFEYGSSQNRLSVISTPAGIFFISQEQGKIFSYAQGLDEISKTGMKWWFNNFLPYRLLNDFPDYPYTDNPVCGIGCQSGYDTGSTIVYFSKTDFELRPEFKGKVTYVPLITEGRNKGKGDYFTVRDKPGLQVKLGNPILFKDASWTVSYDPKMKFWVSFHDWHPDLYISTNRTFLTTKKDGMWKHNSICNSYCNFYGADSAFEIEIPFPTGQHVSTLKSMQYILETYKRTSDNCIDAFHVLDANFDEAVIYNTEQVSGYLNLNLFPKNNVVLSQQYPKLNANLQSFDILFSKEEQKYRFNQFWDITKDRGEFPQGSGYPPTGPLAPGTTELLGNYPQETIWLTEPNGYQRLLNQANLDYSKAQLQRKKFRHYLNFLVLKRKASGDENMIVKIVNSKSQISQR